MARAACPDRRLLESSLRGKARSMLFSNSVCFSQQLNLGFHD